MSPSFPFLFYGSVPTHYGTGLLEGSYAVLFKRTPPAEVRSEIESTLLAASDLFDDVTWEASVLWLDPSNAFFSQAELDSAAEGEIPEFARSASGVFAFFMDVWTMIHKLEPIEEVVNHFSLTPTRSDWELWTLEHKNFPEDMLLDPSSKSAYSLSEKPARVIRRDIEVSAEYQITPEMALASSLCKGVVTSLIGKGLLELAEGTNRESLEDFMLRKLLRSKSEDETTRGWVKALTKAQEVEELYGTDDELIEVMRAVFLQFRAER